MLHHRTKPNGKVELWDKVDGVAVDMAPTDAMHALKVDPERWALDRPADEPAPEPESTGPTEPEIEPPADPDPETDETHDD